MVLADAQESLVLIRGGATTQVRPSGSCRLEPALRTEELALCFCFRLRGVPVDEYGNCGVPILSVRVTGGSNDVEAE
jgi:hypothetical protein